MGSESSATPQAPLSTGGKRRYVTPQERGIPRPGEPGWTTEIEDRLHREWWDA